MAELALRRQRAVALVPGEAQQTQAVELGDPRGERHRLLGRVGSGAIHAGVELDEHADRAADGARGRRELGRVAGVVHRHHHVRLAREVCQRRELPGPGGRVHHEDAVQPGADHDDRLPDGRGRDTDGARLHLHPRQLGALVHLHVRP